MKSEPLLQLHNATIAFGEATALRNVSIKLHAGEIVAVLGPNGAGKSTLLKALVGLVPLRAGSVLVHGARSKPKPHTMTARGVAYVLQDRNVFLSLTVRENLEVGIDRTLNGRQLAERVREVYEVFPMLAKKSERTARMLSGGQRQMLAVARGLMTRPDVLLLDEPSAGLAPNLVASMFTSIREINRRHGTAIMIVEHNVSSVLKIADRAYVCDRGDVVESGLSKAALESRILQSLLG